MNSTVEQFIRAELKQGLNKCTEQQQLLFKRMYSHKNIELAIDEVVNNMPTEKLDWALSQVEKTVLKNQIN